MVYYYFILFVLLFVWCLAAGALYLDGDLDTRSARILLLVLPAIPIWPVSLILLVIGVFGWATFKVVGAALGKD